MHIMWHVCKYSIALIQCTFCMLTSQIRVLLTFASVVEHGMSALGFPKANGLGLSYNQ